MKLLSVTVLCCLLLAAMALPAAAGGSGQGKPSESSCRDLGYVNVQCFEKNTCKYLGLITVPAEYTAQYDDCLPSSEVAKGRCSGAYGVLKNDTSIRWQYKIKSTKFTGRSPKGHTCK